MSWIDDIFSQKGRNLYWHRIDDDHVDPSSEAKPFAPDEAYFVVRMSGMYLARARVLWRKFYPMLHGFTTSGGDEEHSIAGPGQLKELGDANLDKVIVLNHRLVGPLPFRGQDVSIVVGLYSVPGEDAAKALITTVGSLAALGGVAFGQVQQVAEVVKQGVESVLSLGETRLQLGIRDTFYQNNPLRPGYHVGIAAQERDLDVGGLWVSNGRLVTGENPRAAKPYSDHDYMILEIESRDRRDDWPGLPGLTDFEAQFGAIMRDANLTVDQKRQKLSAVWPTFQGALHDSRYLVRPDRERIALSVSEDLKIRLASAESGNPFETRGWSGGRAIPKSANEFDLLDVEDRFDPSSQESVSSARVALTASPF